jgi:DNA-binding NarL/FixJ family response regulator
MSAVSSAEAAAGLVPLMRVLVVDDHITFAELLSRALDAELDLVCVGHATDASQAVAMTVELQPDVVLMDLRLPDRDGISATADLTAMCPNLKVLILTAHEGAAEVARARAAGASGFLAKDGALSEVLDALRTARRGSMILPASVVAGSAADGGSSEVDPGLTARELEVLRLLGQGRDPRAIAKDLGVSLYTCRGYVKSVLAKLAVHSQLEAVVVANRTGLIRVGE